MILGGADEAGKGALYGPAVLAYVTIEKDALDTLLLKYTIRDSKLLTKSTILKIYRELKETVEHHFSILMPLEIDNMNLNTLLTLKYGELIKRNPVANIVIDCPIHSCSLFESTILKQTHIKIKSEHKADFNYPVVSLASIFAKAKREQLVSEIIQITGVDIGSGYPSDPRTKLAYSTYPHLLTKYIRNKWNVQK